MNQTTRPVIRMSDAAAAIGIETKALRNWLVNNDLTAIEERNSERGWRAFSFADVAILAIMRELVRWGLKVEEAHDFAGAFIFGQSGPLLRFKSTPPKALQALMTNRRLMVYRLPESDELYSAYGYGGIEWRATPASCIIVDVERTVGAAFSSLEADGYGLGDIVTDLERGDDATPPPSTSGDVDNLSAGAPAPARQKDHME